MVELVLACLARNSSTYLCALPVLLWKKQARVLSAHLLQQQALSAHPFFPKKEDPDPALPSFPSYILVNHILEYVSVIVSNVESFALKALVASNCGLRFNGSID